MFDPLFDLSDFKFHLIKDLPKRGRKGSNYYQQWLKDQKKEVYCPNCQTLLIEKDCRMYRCFWCSNCLKYFYPSDLKKQLEANKNK